MDRGYEDNQEQLAKLAKALAHPARIAIINFLSKEQSCFFGDIHEVLPISKATVSQHLSELKSAGLIQGEILPPKVKYCLNRSGLIAARQLFGELFDGCLGSEGCCKG